MRRFSVVGLLLLCSTWALSGCGGDGNGIEVVFPTVTATSPVDGATGISLNASISITFSREMDQTTLDSIYVSDMTVYRVDYDNGLKMAAVYIDSLLDPQISYDVTVSSYCMDKSGNNLSGDHTFSFTSGEFGCDELEHPFGDNHTLATAADIEFGRRFKLLPSCGGDENMDYFKFTLTQATTVTVYYKVVYADTNKMQWKCYFPRTEDEYYHAHGSAPIIDDTPHEYELGYSFLPGTYYLMTGKWYDTGHTAVYELIVETSEPCPDDAYEDNDFPDQAVPVNAGLIEDLRGCMSDRDYFSIDLSDGETITATVTQGGGGTDNRRITLYDSTMREIGISSGSTNVLSLVATVGSDDTYYLEVMWWRSDITYDLNIEVAGP